MVLVDYSGVGRCAVAVPHRGQWRFMQQTEGRVHQFHATKEQGVEDAMVCAVGRTYLCSELESDKSSLGNDGVVIFVFCALVSTLTPNSRARALSLSLYIYIFFLILKCFINSNQLQADKTYCTQSC